MTHAFALLMGMLLGLGACSAPPAPSSTAAPRFEQTDDGPGIDDRTADPAVVAVELAERFVCAGSLIAPDVVLTARHCVFAGPPCGSADGSADSSMLSVWVSDVSSSTGVRVPVRSITFAKLAEGCAADMALLSLQRTIDGIEPLAIRSTGIALGDHVRTVDFFAPTGDASTARRLARDHTSVVGTTETQFLLRESACSGGCGGPAIDETSGAIVGVLSGPRALPDGGAPADVATRVDAFIAAIEDALAHASPSVGRASKLKGNKGPLDV